MINSQSSKRLSILNILYPLDFKKWSFKSAFNLLSFPHLAVESISIHKLRLDIKKSIIYRSIGFCDSYLNKQYLIKYFSNNTSCGYNFLLYVLDFVKATFRQLSFNAIGLFFFILSLCAFAQLEFSFLNPHAQWFLPLLFVNLVASLIFLNFNPNRLECLINVSLLTQHLSLKDFIEYPFSQCRRLIMSIKDILKNCSICFNLGTCIYNI